MRLVGRAILVGCIVMARVAQADPMAAISADPIPDPKHPPGVEELTIESHGARLPAVLYLANGKGPHPTVLLLHGLPGNEKNLDIAQAARRAGFNALFFHYRGAWGAEGTYTLTGLADDVATVVQYLQENAARYRVAPEKISLLGHSLGGFAALDAGHRMKDIACVGAMAPANLGLWSEGIASGDAATQGFLAYADTLFMLAGFDAETMKQDLTSVPASSLDTRRFGPGLRGKSVFLVTGAQDEVLPPDAIFDPVVAAYLRDGQIEIEAHTIPGDHSFSQSRIQLTRLVLEWLTAHCRG